MTIFVIEDEVHSEWCGEYDKYEDALTELKSRAAIKWDQVPNICPCTNWQNCGRNYELVEFNDAVKPWEEISRKLVLKISANGIFWE